MSNLSIGIVGYGRMGQEIAQQCQDRDYHIAFIIDPQSKDATAAALSDLGSKITNAQVIIEFSQAQAILENINYYTQNHIPAVIGTTGWEDKKDEIERAVIENEGAIVYGGNFSIGAHLFMRIGAYAAKLLDKIPEYDIGIWESHHNKKLDRPSGTALMTAELMLKELSRKKTICTDIPQSDKIKTEELPIVSQRVGHEMGFHEIIADSPFDTIKISHQARSRSGFALGAVLAAEWLYNNKDKKGLITIHEFIEQLLS